MTAATPLISPLSSATVMENAAVVAISRASSGPSRSSPRTCTPKPKPQPASTRTRSKTNISSIEARIGPTRMANRLAGVTRNRSMTPARRSKTVLNPGPAPVA